MTVEYVDAGEAIDQGTLSGKVAGGEVAPPVVADVNYERILNARAEPQNWLTYYGAYDGQRYSPLDQINTENVKRIGPAWMFQAGASGLIAGASTYSFEAPRSSSTASCTCHRLGRLVLGPRRQTGLSSGDTSTRSPSMCHSAVGTSTVGSQWPRARSSSSPPNAHVLALDATTGKRVWDKTMVTSGPGRAPRSPRWS